MNLRGFDIYFQRLDKKLALLASFTEIHLIEKYNFWSEHEYWVHLVVKS
jgi:hypothetical protein